MRAKRRVKLLRPADWSYATKATVIPSLGLIVISVIIALLATRTARDIQIESLKTDYRVLGQAQARQVAQRVANEVALLNVLAQSNVIVDHAQEHRDAGGAEVPATHEEGSAAIRDEIDRFMMTYPQFRIVVIVDEFGRLIATNSGLPPLDYSGAEWVSFVMTGGSGRLYLNDSRVTMPEDESLRGLEIALPVLNEDSQPMGVVYAVLDVQPIAQASTGVLGSRVLIVNRDALVVADSVEGTVGRQLLQPEVLAVMRAHVAEAAVGPDEDGRQTVFGFAKIAALSRIPQVTQTQDFAYDVAAPMRALGWTVIVSQDVEQALEAAGLLTQRILVLLVVGAAVIIVSVFLFARTLIAPLGRLSEAASNIGAGQLDAPIPDLGRDEIGRLADVLRGTVAQLVERVEQLHAATDVTRAAQAILDIDQMLQAVTQALCERFAFSQARVYLLEPDERFILLRAASGEEDGSPAVDGGRVAVDSRNVLGDCMALGRSQLAQGTRTLMGRGSELAVPLTLGEERLGVMYVASDDADFLDTNDVSVMELLADQVASSIQNARLFEQREANLRYIEELNRRLTREGWMDAIEQSGHLRYVMGSADSEVAWPSDLTSGVRRGETVVTSSAGEDDQAVLAVPINLRGEVIGTLGVKRPPGHEWSDDEIALVQAVGERVALIAEDIRLLNQADRSARREQVVSGVSAKLQRATELDSLLQTALNELSGALGSDSISLRLGPPPGVKGAVRADGESETDSGDGEVES